MKKQLLTLCGLLALASASVSCKKVYDDNSLAPLAQAYAPIPVTVTNADFFERYSGVFAKSLTATEKGAFSITFSIPADKGTIKEISRVATGGSGLLQVQTGTPAQLYNYNGMSGSAAGAIPIPGNGTNTITFTSSLDEYNKYRTRVGTGIAPIAPTVSANPQAPNQINFFFLLTLQDGTTVIPPLVRVRAI